MVSFSSTIPEVLLIHNNTFIGAILRLDNFIIPHGETVIQPADRVIVFSIPDAIPDVEDMFEA